MNRSLPSSLKTLPLPTLSSFCHHHHHHHHHHQQYQQQQQQQQQPNLDQKGCSTYWFLVKMLPSLFFIPDNVFQRSLRQAMDKASTYLHPRLPCFREASDFGQERQLYVMIVNDDDNDNNDGQ